MEVITANVAGRVRRTVVDGREYLVAPLSLIVPGVLNGSKGPLYYPPDHVSKDFDDWHEQPIVVYHPNKNGQHVSAHDLTILNQSGIGFVRNPRYNKKLGAEGWFDVEITRRVDNRVLQALEKGQPIELSTGLFTENIPAPPGSVCPKGRPYSYIATRYKPDHLAILPDQVGACSIKDGCGVLVNQLVTNDGYFSNPWHPLANAGGNCGIGSEGFEEGNTCAKGGSGGGSSSAKSAPSGKNNAPPTAVSRVKNILAGLGRTVAKLPSIAIPVVKTGAKIIGKTLAAAYRRYGNKASLAMYLAGHAAFVTTGVATGGVSLLGAAAFGLASMEAQKAIKGVVGVLAGADDTHTLLGNAEEEEDGGEADTDTVVKMSMDFIKEFARETGVRPPPIKESHIRRLIEDLLDDEDEEEEDEGEEEEETTDNWQPLSNESSLPSDRADINPEKACQILKDGEVHGKPLTEKQRGMFGAICGKRSTNNEWATLNSDNCGTGAGGFQPGNTCAGGSLKWVRTGGKFKKGGGSLSYRAESSDGGHYEIKTASGKTTMEYHTSDTEEGKFIVLGTYVHTKEAQAAAASAEVKNKVKELRESVGLPIEGRASPQGGYERDTESGEGDMPKGYDKEYWDRAKGFAAIQHEEGTDAYYATVERMYKRYQEREPRGQSPSKPAVEPAPAVQPPVSPKAVEITATDVVKQLEAHLKSNGPAQSDFAYQWMQKLDPNLTPEKYKEVMQKAWDQRAVELHAINEVWSPAWKGNQTWQDTALDLNDKKYAYVQVKDAEKFQNIIGQELEGKASSQGGYEELKTPEERGTRLFERIKTDKGLTIDDIRSQFAELEKEPKKVIQAVAKAAGFEFEGSKKEIARRLREVLERLKVSQLKGETIRGETNNSWSAISRGSWQPLANENCGTGAGGFQPGNTCAEGRGRGAVAEHAPHKLKEFSRLVDLKRSLTRASRGEKVDPSVLEQARQIKQKLQKLRKEVYSVKAGKLKKAYEAEEAKDERVEAPGDKRGGGRPVSGPPKDGGRVEREAGRSAAEEGDKGRESSGKSAGEGAARSVPSKVSKPRKVVIPAKKEEVNSRLDQYIEKFRSKGHNDPAQLLEHIKSHVNVVGVKATLESLGQDLGEGKIKEVEYEGGWETMGQFAEEYLNRHGITLLHQVGNPSQNVRLISSMSPSQGAIDRKRKGDFTPLDPTLKNKLAEAKNLPGIESSEDVSVIAGKDTTHLTPEFTEKLDAKYGKGQWLVKAYGDDAAAGFGIFFPQRAEQIRKDAQSTLWSAGEHLSKYGFQLRRDKNNTVVGLKHENGDQYDFGTDKYNETIKDDARKWADKAWIAADHEYGAALPGPKQFKEDAIRTIWEAQEGVAQHGFHFRRNRKGKIVGLKHENGDTYDFGTPKYENTIDGDVREWADEVETAAPYEFAKVTGKEPIEFMAQPAFKAVGVSDADRAAGVAIAPGEGRVHVITRGGKVEVVPHSTWIKNTDIPVVVEDDDTRAMAAAALAAIQALPESERQGQIYAPDVLKSETGYRVVEANPANDTGSSGYLGNNPFIIDAYVSHLTKRSPAHVRFIRKLLSKGSIEGVENKRAKSRSTNLWSELYPRYTRGSWQTLNYEDDGGQTSPAISCKCKGKCDKCKKRKRPEPGEVQNSGWTHLTT